MERLPAFGIAIVIPLPERPIAAADDAASTTGTVAASGVAAASTH
ncbi:MAG: hypothetical protein ABIS17_15480 [Casimicrobiaceae bacterium]